MALRTFARGLVAAVALTAAAPRPASTQQVALRGRVVDAATGYPIAGAEVRVAGDTGIVARSDAAGAWHLRAPARADTQLRIRHAGYRVRTVAAVAGETVVALSPVPLALDQLVVTAARREQRLGDAVVATEVISRADLDRTGASDVGTALTQQTGVQLDAGIPSGAGLQMQGFGARRVLILLDGQPLNGRVNGTFDASRIPSAMVDRVEIVKGPQSTLYGSDAIGGVINILTRPPDHATLDGSLSITAGSQERREVAASLSGGTTRYAGAFDAGYRHLALTPGVSSADATYADRWDAAPRVRFTVDSSATIDASVLSVGERQRYRVGQLYQFADNDQLAARVGLSWRRGAQRFTPALSYSRFDHLSRASTQREPVGTSGDRDRQGLLQLQLAWSGSLWHTPFEAGVDARREDITADRILGGSRVVSAVEPYAQATFTFASVTVVPGARYTWSDRWGSNVAPRLALLWHPAGDVAVRAAAGRGFRAPDFKELYLTFVNALVGYQVTGNPALRPELSDNASVGVEVTRDRGFARVGFFHNRYHDFIEFVGPDATGTYTYGNVADGTTTGVETEGALLIGAARIGAGYAWLRAIDARTSQPLLSRPAHSARASIATPIAGPVRAAVTALYTGSTPSARDAAGNVMTTQPQLLRMNVRLVSPLPLALEAAVGIDNVFDTRLGLAWPAFTGRAAYVSLTWHPRE